MHSTIKRVLAYMAVMAACIVIAINFTETQTQFVAVFGVGLAFGIVAEILFWIHVVRVAWRRRGEHVQDKHA